MAKNEKNISVNTFEQVVNDYYPASITEQWHGIDVKIVPTIGIKSMLEFVNDVVENCFDDESGEYRPEVMDFLVRCNVLTKYANFRLPADIEKRYALVRTSDAVQFVLQYVNYDQYEEIRRAIDRKLRNRSESNAALFTYKLASLTASFEKMQEQMTGLFDGVSPSAVEKFMSMIADGGFSEERLVKAYKDTMLADSTGGDNAS